MLNTMIVLAYGDIMIFWKNCLAIGELLKFTVIYLLMFSVSHCACMNLSQQSMSERTAQQLLGELRRQNDLKEKELALRTLELASTEQKETTDRLEGEKIAALLKKQYLELAKLQDEDKRWWYDGKLYPRNAVIYMYNGSGRFVDNTGPIAKKQAEIATNEARLKLFQK